MISFIKGKIQFINDNSISIRSGDIGYEVNVPVSRVASTLLAEGNDVEIYTRMIVRENDISLWGFFSLQDLKMFQELISVSGVGPKTAQGLVFEVGVESVFKAIMFDDASKLKISGIGLKTAQKIILELKSKLPNKFKFSGTSETETAYKPDSKAEEAKDALMTLGYKEKDIIDALKELKSEDFKTTQDLIKRVLKTI